MVNNYATAEDIFQETWIKVIRHIGSFRGDAKFSTWLFQIARNVYRDSLRRKKGFFLIPLDETDDLISEPAMDAGAIGEREYVQKIVSGLPVKMREAIVLRYYHDLDIKEISEVLGCSLGTVKSRLYYALKAIRKNKELLST